MRILITGIEIAGWISCYKSGFEAIGHSVTTAVFNEDLFYRKPADIPMRDPRRFKFEIRNSLCYNAYNFFRSTKENWSFKKKVKGLIDDHDVVIYLWRPFLHNYADYEYAKRKGKKIITFFVGSDVRYSRSFIQEYKIANAEFCKESLNDSIEGHLRHIRIAEKYSDLIYSVPDQSGLQLRPYYHLQVPLNFSNLKKGVQFDRDFITILHAPSKPWIKGTDIIERTIYKLIDDGLRIKFISIRNMMNSEVVNLLAKSDVLVDEIVAHGPGALSFEAMACGCVVATKYLDSSPDCFRPPVVSVTEENLYEKLRNLLEDVNWRKTLSIRGVDYARENNNVEKIARDIIDNLLSPKDPDYYPTFLRKGYVAKDEGEKKLIEKWDNLVKGCSWYVSDSRPIDLISQSLRLP